MTVESASGRVLAALAQAGVPYMLTGSVAASLYGIGRATEDVDLVIDPTAAQVRRFASVLPPEVAYISLSTALDALSRRSMFNVIDLESGWKFDFIVRKDRPFSRVEFDRRIEVEHLGQRISVATAEDVILSKLEWSKAGGSLRQIEDVARILKARSELDAAYLAHWVTELDVGPQWEAARVAAGR